MNFTARCKMGIMKKGFFFECSEQELSKLTELGDGDAGKGLRFLLESRNINLKQTLNELLKDMGKKLVDASPQIITSLIDGVFRNARNGRN
jgi:hypothetical protein